MVLRVRGKTLYLGKAGSGGSRTGPTYTALRQMSSCLNLTSHICLLLLIIAVEMNWLGDQQRACITDRCQWMAMEGTGRDDFFVYQLWVKYEKNTALLPYAQQLKACTDFRVKLKFLFYSLTDTQFLPGNRFPAWNVQHRQYLTLTQRSGPLLWYQCLATSSTASSKVINS